MSLLRNQLPEPIAPRLASRKGAVRDEDQLAGVFHRQRAQQQGVDERKNGRVGTYPKRQREHGDDRDNRSGAEHTNSETEVLNDAL